MKAVTTRADQSGYRTTHDGKYYMYSTYGGSQLNYSIGIHTENGSQHLEDVRGYRQAVKRLREIIKEAQGE
jgi:hypothetical protein